MQETYKVGLALGVTALPLDGLAANLVAVQLSGIWIMPWAIVSMFLLPFGLEGYARVPMTAGIEVIMNVAHSVASLAGAVGFVRTGPIAGISIVALAGLWLCLWRGRWRFLGVICGALSVSISTLPDVLISKSDAKTVGKLND